MAERGRPSSGNLCRLSYPQRPRVPTKTAMRQVATVWYGVPEGRVRPEAELS